jgi:hypothetical protein
MFPITSFTASLGHDGNIDIFALALSPQAQAPQGQGATVFRIRQKKAGGDWQSWANAGKPGLSGLSPLATAPEASAQDAGALAGPLLVPDSDGRMQLFVVVPATRNVYLFSADNPASCQLIPSPLRTHSGHVNPARNALVVE